MLKLMIGICASNAALARYYPHVSQDSYFKIFDVVSIQPNAARTICFENHFYILRLALKIKPSVIFGDNLLKSFGIGIKQGIFEPLKCEQELFFCTH